MPYTINPTRNPLAIAERQSAQALDVPPSEEGETRPTVQFTTFTSCIGIVARNRAATSVIGVHLAIFDGDTRFTAADVPIVIASLGDYDPSKVIVFGQISAWQASVGPAYDALLAELPQSQQHRFGDGQYGAGINEANELEVTF